MKFDPTLVSTRCNSPLGPLILAASRKGLAGIWFDDQRHLPEVRDWPTRDDEPVLRRAAAQLAEYFEGRRQHFDLPLDLDAGTAFQQAVWQALLTIAPGQVSSYGAIGRQIGRPAAVRAVGAAVGRNPLGIVVPCHRVLGSNGSLTGYAGGLDRKVALLRLEGVLL